MDITKELIFLSKAFDLIVNFQAIPCSLGTVKLSNLITSKLTNYIFFSSNSFGSQGYSSSFKKQKRQTSHSLCDAYLKSLTV